MYLSKTFDTLNQEFLSAKLKANSLQPTALKQMENYLTVYFQMAKISNSYTLVHGLK